MKDSVTVELRLNEDENLLKDRIAKKCGIKSEKLKFRIVKKAVDARNRNDIKFVYNVAIGEKAVEESFETARLKKTVAVVGAGPAGLFCALYLARHGIKPIVFERGEQVEKRKKTVEVFFSGGKLNERSNVQFGEGGAGAFSDGKLNTQVNNGLIGRVLKDFVRFGAPEEVEYLNKPHIGSDRLPAVVKNLREEIISLGGEFRFDSLVTDIIIRNGRAVGVKCGQDAYESDFVVLAIGHSARDTFELLKRKGVFMEPKDFAVGYRIEQEQELINKDRYGRFFAHPKLPAADYKLVSHASERAVFTFCMCPGGEVIAASSESGGLCVNGMSNYARDKKNANSAVVCQVRKEDFLSDDALAGMRFQKKIEELAYIAGGGDHIAPVQLAEDFIKGERSKAFSTVSPSYSRGTVFADLSALYPPFVVDAIRLALADMDKKIKGFASLGAILTGVETRTSSPVRITRGDSFESVNVKGLYPCGEGCGYAGGITSAAQDGIKVAEAIFGLCADN